MARLVVQWAEVALDQYLALDQRRRASVDACLQTLAEFPDGPGSWYDLSSDTWTAADPDTAGVIVYTFRVEGPKLVVLRLIYL